MVDLKKEIKLSDLVPRRKPKAGGAKTLASSTAAHAPSGEARARRPQGRRVAARGRAGDEQRLRQPRSAGAWPARPRHLRRPARCATCRRWRGRSTTSSGRTSFRAAASGLASRRTASACGPSTSTGSRTSGSSRTRSASARTRPSRSRSTRRCSTTTSSARPSTTRAASRGGSFSRLPTASRSTATSRPAGGEDRAVRDRSRGLCAPARRRRRPRRRSETGACRRRRLARTRSLDPRDLRRRGLRVHARARVGRRQARGGDRARPRRHARRCVRAASSRPRWSLTATRRAGSQRCGAVREAIRRELEKLARELISSLQFYQSQPGRWRSRRSSSRVGRAGFRDCRKSSSV